ncbi:chymotrypsinogen A-like [Tachypleus tridentatus]|uniref:chymotrypsinogen A-like n=1 Tax=Tachypleus tridentatus TaxID=6853 RepID=UPI003FD66485
MFNLFVFPFVSVLCVVIEEGLTLAAPLTVRNLYIATKTSNLETKRILGGETVEEDSYPWMVRLKAHLLNRPGYKINCGGTLISARYLVTAAHCVREGKDIIPVLNLQGKIYKNETSTTLEFDKIISHPKFNSMTLANDIAVLRLKTPLDQQGSICLSTSFDESKQDVTAVVLGWGKTEQGKGFSSTLRRGEVKIIKWKSCSKTWGGTIGKEVLCAEGTNQGICSGDSGGPLVLRKAGRWSLIGVSSFTGGRNCSKSTMPNGFTRISYFISWLKEVTQDHSLCFE